MASDPSPLTAQDWQKTSPLPPQTPGTPGLVKGLNPLSNKVSTVLSASYADSEFRDSLSLLDERAVQNNAETRRQLRLNLQKEVIESNGEIIGEFGRVADVSSFPNLLCLPLDS